MLTTTTFDTILKRNGHPETFNPAKITAAILKAAKVTQEFGEDIAHSLTTKTLCIAHESVTSRPPSVEELQDVVEDVLLSSPYKKTAKAYILYRDQRARSREIASTFNIDLMDKYLSRSDWQVNENSNMAYSLQGLNNYVSSEISKMYWLNKIYPENIRNAHLSGDLHIHDLGALSVYCVGWDLQDLLREGFKGVSGKLEAAPARHFRTALGQMVNFFYTLQGEAAGAQAFANVDTLLAPFIRNDHLGLSEVKQSLQEFLFNVNVPTRVGFQTPFTNITLDLNVPRHLADQRVIVGGEAQAETYKEFQKEMDVFNRALLEVMLAGDAKGRVFTFPIPTYNIGKDFDWENPQLRPLWEITAKYGVPYFANFVNSEMSPDDARSMCCRLRIDNRELRKRGGGLFGASPLTGSIGVVTLNLPRLGRVSKDEVDFLRNLDRAMTVAKDSLEIKRKVLERLTDDDLYPYIKFYLRDIKQRHGRYWENHFSTIGVVGMNEACQTLFTEGIASERGRSFALRVMSVMRETLLRFQDETGNLYNLEATPAEGTSHRLAQLDRKRFPVSTPTFYTNSTQLPVDFTEDPFETLDHQDDLQSQYTGGTVQHLFLGERVGDPVTVREFLRKIMGRYKLPYVSITPTFSVCPNCGYTSGEKPLCPSCGGECEVYSRVVGYLRPVKQWNTGKRAEFKARKVYHL